MADTKPSDVTLEQRITNAYNLMKAARRNGEEQAEQAYMGRVNALLERVPRRTRF
ncbi:hypothetical protein [Rhodococcus sp. 05-2255-3B1]|uniref:hypothetical protein n=1 Tax=Rhodococcus sp. 05-2255-3B1 TaxID=2022482 RepID=UPI0015C696D1|nr:hypothetical protein [Rhodococcus sp. 05-2255-3B1]